MKMTPWVIALAILLGIQAQAADNELPIKIEKAWVRAVPAVAEDTAAYMILTNTGTNPLKLTGGSTPIAAMVHAMVTTRKLENGTESLGMKIVDGIDIPAGGQAVLTPQGDHLMLMGMTQHPNAGETVRLTLRFDPGAQEITLDLPVSKTEPR
ncbi:MAG: copper chaperone PCu(A)C [Verrucomicrobiota bacterium]